MTPKVWVLLTVLGLAQRARIELWREPWARIPDVIQREGDPAAQAALVNLGREETRARGERAFAYRWAARLALRGHRLDEAERYLWRARAIDPRGYEGRMSLVHLGEVAMQRRQWLLAEQWLRESSRDPDRVIASYGEDRLRDVAPHTAGIRRRRRNTALAIAAGVLTVALSALVALRARRRRTRHPA